MNLQPLHNEVLHFSHVELSVLKPLPLPQPFYDATMGPFTALTITILKLVDVEGIAEEMPVNGSAVPYLENILLPLLLSCKDQPYETIMHKLYWSIRNEGFRGNASVALGQLDCLLHGYAARKRGIPLRQLFGVKSNKVPVYASGGSVHLPTRNLVQEVQRYVDEGYTCIKIKIGKDDSGLHTSLGRIARVRKAIGNNIKLAADVNQAWTVDTTLAFAKMAEDCNLAWLEEPVPAADLIATAAVCRQSKTSIAAGESERCGAVIPSLLQAGIKHLQAIPGYLTTVKEWLQCTQLAHQNNLAVSAGGFSLINCHWVGISGHSAMTEYLIQVLKPMEIIYGTAPSVIDGHFHLTEEPGLGTVINWHKLEKEGLVRHKKQLTE